MASWTPWVIVIVDAEWPWFTLAHVNERYLRVELTGSASPLYRWRRSSLFQII